MRQCDDLMRTCAVALRASWIWRSVGGACARLTEDNQSKLPMRLMKKRIMKKRVRENPGRR